MRSLVVTCCLLSLPSLLSSTASAQWYSDSLTNTPVAIAKYDQRRPEVTSDGAGGAIIVWQDHRSGYNWDVYAQRVDPAGKRLWGSGGIAIAATPYDQRHPQICTDGEGGAFIVWEDARARESYDIYAQHVNKDGELSYISDGIPIGKGARDQLKPVIVNHSTGKAIVAWEDERASLLTARPDIYLNVLTKDGSKYGEVGSEAAQGSGGQYNPRLLADGQGGALLAWENAHTLPTSVVASLLDGDGVLKWNPGGSSPGIQIFKGLSYANHVRDIALALDGSKFLIAFEVTNFSTSLGQDLYANRVDRSGVVQYDGSVEVTGEWPGDQTTPVIFSDDSNGFIVFFEDYTSEVSPRFYNRDIAAVRVAPDGISRRPPYEDGFAFVARQSRGQTNTRALKDGESYVFAWDDARSGNGDTAIYIQFVDRNFNRYLPQFGASSWGKAIANRPDAVQKHISMTAIAGGGYILAWSDSRSGDADIYAQIVFKNGTLPIELASFDARSVGEHVLLDWRTANETDNAGFEIERRETGMSAFETVASYESVLSLMGAGTSIHSRHYSHTDAPRAGRYEYRLVDVSIDGIRTTHPSKHVEVARWDDFAMRLISNPVIGPILSVDILSTSAGLLEVHDLLGRRLSATAVESQGALNVPVDDLSPGVYTIGLTVGHGTDPRVYTQRFTKL
jgi:hypothetical protein